MNLGKYAEHEKRYKKDAKEDGSGEWNALGEIRVPKEREGINKNNWSHCPHTINAMDRFVD